MKSIIFFQYQALMHTGLLLVSLLALALTVNGGSFAEWAINLSGGETSIPASYVLNGLTVSPLQPDSALVDASDNSVWQFSNWSTSNRDGDSQRITWTVTPKPGRFLSLSEFVVSIVRDAAGPTQWDLIVRTPREDWFFNAVAVYPGLSKLLFQTTVRVGRGAGPGRHFTYVHPIIDGLTYFELYGHSASGASGVGGIANATTPFISGAHAFMLCPTLLCSGKSNCSAENNYIDPGVCGTVHTDCDSTQHQVIITQDLVSENYTVTTYADTNCTVPMDTFTGPCGDCSDLNTWITCNQTCVRQLHRAAGAASSLRGAPSMLMEIFVETVLKNVKAMLASLDERLW